jgi:hypothetical protein
MSVLGNDHHNYCHTSEVAMFRLRIAKLSKGLVGVACRTAQKPSAVPHIRYFSSTVDKDGPKGDF